MVALIWAEIVGWGTTAGWRMLFCTIGGLALVGSVTSLHPAAIGWVLVISSLYVGLMTGKQTWSKVKPHDWVIEAHLSPGLVLLGRIITAELLGLAHVFIALPLLVLMLPLWGIDGAFLVRVLWLTCVTTFTAASLSLLGNALDRWNMGYFGEVFTVIWLAVSAFIVPLQTVNPFVVMEFAARPGSGVFPLRLLNCFVLGLVLALTGSWVFKREVAESS